MINALLDVLTGGLFGKVTRVEVKTVARDGAVTSSAVCVGEADWMSAVEQLRNDSSKTVRFRFTNGKLFTVPEFVDGNEERITGRVNGIPKEFWRRGVKFVEVVPKRLESFPRSFSEGFVTAWKEDRKFGFLRDDKGMDFYFNERTIKDIRLRQGLDDGVVGQRVRFRTLRQGLLGKPALVEVVEYLSEGINDTRNRSAYFSKGWLAKNAGRVEDAIDCFRKVMDNPEDENYLSAIKELAECVNRNGKPDEAMSILEEHRGDFPASEQVSLDRMEIIYLQKAGRYQDEIGLISKLLLRDDIPENQRAFYQERMRRLQAMEGADVSEDEGAEIDEDKRKLAKLIDQCRRGGVSDHWLDKVGKYFIELWGKEDPGAEFRTIVLNVIQTARRFGLTQNYEKRLSDYTIIKEHARLIGGVLTQSTIPGLLTERIMIPLLKCLGDAVKDSLEQGATAPMLSMSHDQGAGYAVDEYGLIHLRIRLCAKNETSRTIRDVMAMVPTEKKGEPVLVCKALAGGSEIVFDLAMSPLPEEREKKKGVVVVQLDYGVDGALEGQVVQSSYSQSLTYTIEDDVFQPIHNGYREYAGGKRAEGDYFVGRKTLVDEIFGGFTRDSGGSCFVIHGQRRSGKTSVKDNLIKKLNGIVIQLATDVNCCLPVCEVTEANFRGVTCSPLMYLCESMIPSVAKILGMEKRKLKEDLDYLFSKENYVSRIKDMGERIAATSRTWIVVLDELSDLFLYDRASPTGRSEVKAFMGVIKQLLETKTCHFLLVGMDSLVDHRVEFANDSGVMEFRRVSYLTEEDVRDLADIPLLMAGKSRFPDPEVEEDLFHELYDYSGGVPQLTHWICSKLVDRLNAKKRNVIVGHDLERAVEELCVGADALQAPAFESFLDLRIQGVDEEKLVTLYYDLAERTERGSMCDVASLQLVEEDAHLVNVLMDRQVLMGRDGWIRLRSGLFAEWLRHHNNPRRRRNDFSL